MRNLGGLAAAVIVMVAINALVTPVVVMCAWFAPTFYTTQIGPIASTMYAGALIFTIATMIVFAIWIHRAGKNLVDAGLDSLEFTPAARIWWFFVPFANLVKPLHGMRELWNASHGDWPYDRNQPLLATWWALWLISGFAANLARRVQLPALILASAAIGIALAVVAIMLVRSITAAQGNLGDRALTEIFA